MYVLRGGGMKPQGRKDAKERKDYENTSVLRTCAFSAFISRLKSHISHLFTPVIKRRLSIAQQGFVFEITTRTLLEFFGSLHYLVGCGEQVNQAEGKCFGSYHHTFVADAHAAGSYRLPAVCCGTGNPRSGAEACGGHHPAYVAHIGRATHTGSQL